MGRFPISSAARLLVALGVIEFMRAAVSSILL